MPFQLVALVCALTISHSECQIDTAREVTWGAKYPNELACMREGEMSYAGAIGVAPAPDEYFKLSCPRIVER